VRSNYPSSNSYVNSATGSDANSGSSANVAVRTISAAVRLAYQSSSSSSNYGSTIILADGVYRESITLPSAAQTAQTWPIVFRSASGNSNKVSIRCSNQISGASFQLLPPSLASVFSPSAKSQIYTADLAALGWEPTDLLLTRDDYAWCVSENM
jgi:hypothetical protein